MFRNRRKFRRGFKGAAEEEIWWFRSRSVSLGSPVTSVRLTEDEKKFADLRFFWLFLGL